MLILVDDRSVVCDAYCTSFQNIGQKVEVFSSFEYSEWLASAPRTELDPVEGILFGSCGEIESKIRKTREKSRAPLLALVEGTNLGEVLELFEAGADDIVRKPIHVREILCRINAIRRRGSDEVQLMHCESTFKVFFDGRDAVVGGQPLILPRRERRLLEYFSANMGRRLTKDQLFDAVYGIFEDDVHECVIESHVSKLRRKLRERLGYDPIDSKRHIGYCFEIFDGGKSADNCTISDVLSAEVQIAM